MSAWGAAWGLAWGAAWGSLTPAPVLTPDVTVISGRVVTVSSVRLGSVGFAAPSAGVALSVVQSSEIAAVTAPSNVSFSARPE